jgi:hypothetical protein
MRTKGEEGKAQSRKSDKKFARSSLLSYTEAILSPKLHGLPGVEVELPEEGRFHLRGYCTVLEVRLLFDDIGYARSK